MADGSVARDGPGARPDRRARLHGLSALLARVLAPAARERGFAEAAIFADWPRIVGASLAARCLPLRIDFPRGRGRHGTLLLGCGAAAALELQHLAPQIVERINGFFGFPAIARLRFRHVALPPPRRVAAKPPRELRPEERARLGQRVQGVAAPGLREALLALGEDVLRSSPAGAARC